MGQDAAYARSRESGRLAGIVTFGALVLVLGLGVSFTVAGPARIFAVALILLILMFFAIVFARTPDPATLTPLAARVQEGAWPASVPAFVFPDLLRHDPRMRATSELTGTVTFSQSGVTWMPSHQTQRSFGAQPTTWNAGWIAEAKRLRGFGGLVQLTLTQRETQQCVTLWMRRATTFQIASPSA